MSRIGHGGRRCLTQLAVIVAAATIGHGSSAWGQCSNDAGAGDTAEGEACPLDETNDTTNGGCNSSPPAFTDVASDGDLPRTFCASVANYNNTTACTVDGDCPDGSCDVGTGLCLGVNEPAVNQRDTDWYLLSAAQLAAGDTDGNGTVRVTSAVTGEAGLDLVTFFITVDNPVDCNASVTNSVGCWNGTGSGDNANFPLGQTVADDVFIISENPFGVIVFVAPGECDGSGIFNGYECSGMVNDYTVTIATDTAFENGDFTACGDPAQNPQLLPCGEANPGVNGCDDPDCCAIVCEQAIPQCCFHELGWIQQCAAAAVDLGCATECGGGPICLESGPDSNADGYCSICADPYGSWSSDNFGGGGAGDAFWGDAYNPIGGAGPPALDLQEVSFTNGFYFFRRDGNGVGIQRELLSNILDWQGIFAPDNSIQRTILGSCGILYFDDNSDGALDRFESSFILTGAGVDLDFQLTQQLESIPGVATVLTQTLEITNNDTESIDFTLVRSMDGDLVWNASIADTVGTDANGSGCTYVWQGETGLPGTYITISSDQAGVYFGAKAGVDPDGAGPCPPMVGPSDGPLWDAYGVPCAWENYIAGVGADINGESGPTPPGCELLCDASIGLSIPVTDLAPGGSTTVVVHTTYGAASPLGSICDPAPCVWDCGDFDGEVGIVDFLAVLAQWGQVGPSCDVYGDGVGIDDFLGLLGNWGPCP